MSTTPRSTIREVDGQLVLDDPDAVALINAVNKHKCKTTFNINEDRITHFKRRMQELGKSPQEVLIVVLNVDDPNGGPLADILMPGTDWQQFRDRGEVPFARGLALREPIQGLLDSGVDKDAANKLRAIDGTAVMVMDHSAIEIFTA